VNEVVPSASVVLPGVQVKVSAEVGLVGVRLTEAKTGALLLIVTVAVFAVPEALPSLGVTEHTTVLPLTNTPESVLALPFDVPFTVQAYVYETVSPSASAPPEGVQVKVLAAVGLLGLMLVMPPLPIWMALLYRRNRAAYDGADLVALMQASAALGAEG